MLTMQSSLNDIINSYRDNIYLRPFGARCEETGLIDYSPFLPKDIDTNKIQRKVYGFQNAARLAALLPHLLKVYQDNKAALKPEFQKLLDQFNCLNEDTLKAYQVIASLLASGHGKDTQNSTSPSNKKNNPDLTHSAHYTEQTIRECQVELENLSVLSDEAKALASAIPNVWDIQSVDHTSTLPLLTTLLADAVRIEAYRIPDKEHVNLALANFSFMQYLQDPQSASGKKASQDFVELIAKHVNLISHQQGFVCHQLTSIDEETPLPESLAVIVDELWPTVNTSIPAQAENFQRYYEHHCRYKDIAADVNAAQQGLFEKSLNGDYEAQQRAMATRKIALLVASLLLFGAATITAPFVFIALGTGTLSYTAYAHATQEEVFPEAPQPHAEEMNI